MNERLVVVRAYKSSENDLVLFHYIFPVNFEAVGRRFMDERSM